MRLKSESFPSTSTCLFLFLLFPFLGKRKWQISSTLIWQPIRHAMPVEEEVYVGGVAATATATCVTYHMTFCALYFQRVFCEFRLPRNWIKQPEMTNERTERVSGKGMETVGGVDVLFFQCMYVCALHVCTRNFPFVNFSLCAERCRFSRFRHASNIDEAAAFPATAWQPDRHNNNINEYTLTSSLRVCVCVCMWGCQFAKKKRRKYATGKNRSWKINGRQARMFESCCRVLFVYAAYTRVC